MTPENIMGRHKQPREIAKLKGADKVHPERYRGEVPKHESPIGEPPEYLTDEVRAVWFELESLAIPGVLTAADRPAFEAASNLLAEYREDPRACATARINSMIALLGRFGMTPSDRTKLAVETKEKSTFEMLN